MLPNVFVARRSLVVELVLMLSLLSACGGDSPPPTAPDGPPPGASSLDLVYCRGSEPAWVAYQDGDGAWTRAQPRISVSYTRFRVSFTANRGAVARASRFESGLTSLAIQYGLPSEFGVLSDTGLQGCSGQAPRTLFGTVAGLDTGEVAFVSAGNAVRDFATREDGNTFELGGLRPGPQEILVTRGRPAIGLDPTAGMILRRVPALPDGATLSAFDFDSPEAFKPVRQNLSFAGVGSTITAAFTGLHTAHTNTSVTFFTGVGPVDTRSYYAIPEDRLEADELQSVSANTVSGSNAVAGATVYFHSPSDRTLTFGALPSAPAVSVVASAPTTRLRARFDAQSDYDRLASISYQQGANTAVTVSMTQGYADLVPGGYDLVVPELTGVQGFDASWALHSGVNTTWTSARIGGTLDWYFTAVPHDGDTRRYVTDAGVLTP